MLRVTSWKVSINGVVQVNKVTYNDNGFILFYRSDLYRSIFRFSGLTTYFSDILFIPSIGHESDYYIFENCVGAETAKISTENIPEELQSKLDLITQEDGHSE